VLHGQAVEAVIAAGASCLRGQALSPLIAAHVVANLDFVVAIHILHCEAAVTDQFAAGFQDHGPEAVTVFRVALEVARNPRFDTGAVERGGIEAHRCRVG
jgi:hypothetical protein